MAAEDLPTMTDPGRPPALSAVEAIIGRRTARRFDPDRPLPDALLETILRLATLAPSADNLQPWRFIAVRSSQNRRRLRACAGGLAILTEAPVALIVLGYLHPQRTHLEAILGQQLELKAITPEEAAASRAMAERRSGDPLLRANRSAMMSAATLMIAAESLGVATAAVEHFDPGRVKRAFGVPDDHAIVCLIALGFAAEPAPFPGRLVLDEVCYREHFGQPWAPGPGGGEGGMEDGRWKMEDGR